MYEHARHFLTTTACIGGLFASLASGFVLQAAERTTLLDHRSPTGVAGRWSAVSRPGVAGIPQPVRVILPSKGKVTFYTGSPQGLAAIPVEAPAMAAIGVGYVYRLQIGDMPEYPGVKLYPTIELLDRLSPPAGLELEFPIPVQITAEEIETAMQDRLVTKVIYLEQPDLAYPQEQAGIPRIESLPPTVNLLQAADLRGRPMAIIRIGGRIPDPRAPGDEFFSQSPLQVIAAEHSLPSP